jgi:di/tricarboxylate transporter
MFAASMAFTATMGYRTTLLVYGPGGSRFSDYLPSGGRCRRSWRS